MLQPVSSPRPSLRGLFYPARLTLLVLLALLCFGNLTALAASPVSLATELGQPFPDMQFGGLLAPEDYASLGLPRSEGGFRLEEVPGELLVLEFFSQYCLTCQRQAPLLDSFYKVTRKGDLLDRIRVLAVAVGSRSKNLGDFRRELKISYPIAPDPYFERLLELGDPGGTPFTVFLQRREGRWHLSDYHLGLQGDAELLARSRVLLEGRAQVAVPAAKDEERTFHPPLGLSGVQQEKRAREFLSELAGRELRVVPVDLGDQGRLYRALNPDGTPGPLFARIASRDPVCDVCHAIHFLFAFDGSGAVRGYQPIHVTKYGNEKWSAEDNAKLSGRLLGKPMQDLEFDPEVDAVTSATMSSALIFDEVRRAAALLARATTP